MDKSNAMNEGTYYKIISDIKKLEDEKYMNIPFDNILFEFKNRNKIEDIFKVWNNEFLRISDIMNDYEKKRRFIMKVLREINSQYTKFNNTDKNDDVKTKPSSENVSTI